MKQEMIRRTKKFAVDVWLMCSKLPHSRAYNSCVNQLIRCSSSVAANFRAVGRAKSKADFINKLKIVEEADESQFFLEVLDEINSSMDLSSEIKRLIKSQMKLLQLLFQALKHQGLLKNKQALSMLYNLGFGVPGDLVNCKSKNPYICLH